MTETTLPRDSRRPTSLYPPPPGSRDTMPVPPPAGCEWDLLALARSLGAEIRRYQ